MRWIAGILSLMLCASIAQPSSASVVYSTTGVVDAGGFVVIDAQVFPHYMFNQIAADAPFFDADVSFYNGGYSGPFGVDGPFGTFINSSVNLRYVFETSATFNSATSVFVSEDVTGWGEDYGTLNGQIIPLGGPDCLYVCGSIITPNIGIHTLAFLDTAISFDSFSTDSAGDYHFLGERPDGASIYLGFDPSDAGQTYSLTVYSVPEPATWAYLVAGVGLIGSRLRRRRAQVSPLSC